MVFQCQAVGQPALPTSPGLGAYSDIAKQICGNRGVKWNPTELPWIGCFGLSAGNSASGAIDRQHLEVAVDSNGKEICKVDGAAMECNGCIQKNARYCNTTITVISQNLDKSVFLYLAQRVWGFTFVTNEENWKSYNRPMRCEQPIEGAEPDPLAPNRQYQRCYAR
jgi:hypothetical protein